MQTEYQAEYVDAFATAYDRFWSSYPRKMGAAWLELFARLAPDAPRSLLDVGCGTGVVAARFAEAGYRVVGVDISEAMLTRARRLLEGANAELIHADAADFTVAQPCAFALSTYDIPNHIGSLERVRSYLECVHRSVLPGGWFGFDMSTVRGLAADMPAVTRVDDETSVAVVRGTRRGDMRPLYVSGRARTANGEFVPFTTTISNTAHELADVLDTMAEIGWCDVYVASIDDLHTPAAEPEQLPRVAIVARRGQSSTVE